jgi:Ner family transcriptional regulator
VTKPVAKTDIPSSPGERSLWVQMQLRLRGSSFAAIARKHGWAKTTVSMAMKTPSYNQEQAIADELGMAVEDLFPERYSRGGRRLHHVRKHSSRSSADNVQKEAAA